MTIGRLALAAGVAVSTVRFYERQGLVEPDERSRAGYRSYTPEAVQRVRFIRRAQRLGFTLREVGDVLRLSDRPELITLEDVGAQVAEKISELDQKIVDLQRVREALRLLVATGPAHPRCPVIEAIT
ncbi:heavy metal-responsive transcriptional regulator [Microbacterium sp. SD291]|uniref:heavy metal-responsive transcriptional regulator n=1 Tax=Microbacterium sp. SD291 TaxID=2782007 RepID=UPI001A9588FA|nr:heavy metal-responsive transcriptional regulator [Microbacterium sp. SD291]MBO0980349.1 heavy metal-responsive transcriptional regulator [Microbacterium sp. SD291]